MAMSFLLVSYLPLRISFLTSNFLRHVFLSSPLTPDWPSLHLNITPSYTLSVRFHRQEINLPKWRYCEFDNLLEDL